VESSGVGSIHGTDQHANYQNQEIIVRWVPFTRQQSHWVDSRRVERRQLATSSSGHKVDTDPPRPPSIVVAAPLRTRSLLDTFVDVGQAWRRVPGGRRMLHWRGPRPGPSLFVPWSRRAVALVLFSLEHGDCATEERRDRSTSPSFATQDPAL
jgi:hypothetical protein